MRLYEISNTPLEVAQALQSCQAALSSKHSIYRGMEMRPFQEQFVRNIRQDRMLKDSSKVEGRLFDVCCEVLGFPHRKANTLSCARSAFQAANYGITVYEVFPVDGSSYLYSSAHNDFLDVSLGLWKFWNGMIKDGEQEDIIDPTDEDFKSLFMKHKNRLMQITQLNMTQSLDEAAANARGEVLVYGTKYVGKFYDHLQ